MTSFIDNIQITDAMLVATNLADDDDHAAYDAATIYAEGDEVSGATTHQNYKSVQNGNMGNSLDDPDWWVVQNFTNKFRAFDRFIADQAVNADVITYSIAPGVIVDSIALFNVAASSIQITVTSSLDGEVFDETFPMSDLSFYIDAYQYFFGAERKQTKLLLEKFPPYSDATIDITINNPGTTAGVGQIDLGRGIFVGTALEGTRPTMDDFSGRSRDDFGRFNLVERDYSEGVEYRIAANINDIDRIRTLVATRRGKPTTFYVSDNTVKMGTMTYGIPKETSPALQFGATIFTLEVEGFT